VRKSPNLADQDAEDLQWVSDTSIFLSTWIADQYGNSAGAFCADVRLWRLELGRE
jgi:hypothetical protein